MVPGCLDRIARFLDQDMIVEDACRIRAHQLRRDLRHRRLNHQRAITGKICPNAVILEKFAALTLFGPIGAFAPTRVTFIFLDGLTHSFYPGREYIPKHHNPVRFENLNNVIGDQIWAHLFHL